MSCDHLRLRDSMIRCRAFQPCTPNFSTNSSHILLALQEFLWDIFKATWWLERCIIREGCHGFKVGSFEEMQPSVVDSMHQSLQILVAGLGESIGFLAILLLGCTHDCVDFTPQLGFDNSMCFSEIDPHASHSHAFLERLRRLHTNRY
jgi:hypothetical protein